MYSIEHMPKPQLILDISGEMVDVITMTVRGD